MREIEKIEAALFLFTLAVAHRQAQRVGNHLGGGGGSGQGFDLRGTRSSFLFVIKCLKKYFIQLFKKWKLFC